MNFQVPKYLSVQHQQKMRTKYDGLKKIAVINYISKRGG